jgi:hypothetical protein
MFAAHEIQHRDSKLSLTATSFLRNEIFMFQRPSQISDLVTFWKDLLPAFILLFSQSANDTRIPVLAFLCAYFYTISLLCVRVCVRVCVCARALYVVRSKSKVS